MASITYIALLRGINVGSGGRVPMDRLRSVCEQIGWRDVRSYIQSGNIIFRSAAERNILEEQLELAMPQSFGVAPAVIVKTIAEWTDLALRNPFVDEARHSPSRVMLAVSKRAPASSAVDTLRARAVSERVERIGDALWIYFPDGAGRSRLTPVVLDRAAGCPVTTRNMNTVLRIADLASQ